MSFFDFLKGAERQLNPLDNNLTFKNTKATSNAAVATQAKNLGVGVAKGAVSSPWFFLKQDIVNPVKSIGGTLTGNTKAQQNAESFYKTPITSQLRQFGGNAAQLGLSYVLPEVGGTVSGGLAEAGVKGVANKLATGAVTGAVAGAPYNIANTISDPTQKLSAGNLAKSAAYGAAGGAALGAAGEAVGIAAKNRPSQIQASKISGIKPDNVVNGNEAGTLSDYAQYVMKRDDNGRQVNPSAFGNPTKLIEQARNAAKTAGIDITSGSSEDIHTRIADYLEARDNHIAAVNKVGQGGSISTGKSDFNVADTGKLTITPKGIDDLSKASSVDAVNKVFGNSLPQSFIDKVAPAIAHTKDPNIIQNIISKSLSSALPSDTTKLTTASISDAVGSGQGSGSATPGATSVSNPLGTPPASNPVQNVVKALQDSGIQKLQQQQKNLYSTERTSRLGAAQNTGDLTGRQATYSQLGALKGALPKVDSTALVQHLKSIVSPNDVNGILDSLRTHPNLSGYEPITAQNSIVKLFDEGKLPTEGEFKILQKALGSDFTDTLKTTAVDSMSNWQKVKSFGAQVLGMPKSLMASMDLSGGGRQGAVLGSRFMPEWLQAQKESVKYFASDQAYKDGMAEVAARENAPIYQKMKLNLASLGGHEEQFPSNLGEKIPIVGRGVAASDRAYTGGLTQLRANAADHIISDLKDAGIDASKLGDKQLKSIGQFINTASGRGDLGALEKHAQSLGEALFSPRLWKSRLDMLNPAYYAKLDPVARKYALQSAGSFASIAGTVLTLAAAAGATVETDPRSSDFLKIKVGDTRYDILGGFQQNLVLAHRELPGTLFGQKTYIGSGEKKNSTTGNVTSLTAGKFGGANRLSILSDFVQNKENPVFSTGQKLIAGTDKSGNKVNPATEVGKLFIPLNAQDTYTTAKNTGSIPKSIVKATIPGSVGVGVNTYGLKDIKPTSKQQHYIDKISDPAQKEASTRFFQTLKSGPSRQSASDEINKALASGNQGKAQKIAAAYNKQYQQLFDNWRSQYGKYRGDEQLVKAYNSNKINLTSSSINARLKTIKDNQ